MSRYFFGHISRLQQSSDTLLINILVAIVSATAGLLLSNYFASRLEKKKLYGEAYKVALSWEEMLYRVRRRLPGQKAAHELIDRFHSIQEDINYYQGILYAENQIIGRSYDNLVSGIKQSTMSLIQKAWDDPIRKPSGVTPLTDKHPNNNLLKKQFLDICRDWLSIYRWPLVLWRGK